MIPFLIIAILPAEMPLFNPEGKVQCLEFSRKDIDCYYVPATQLAAEHEISGAANIILIGKMIKESGLFTLETIKKALEKCIPPKRMNLFSVNLKAIEIGMSV